LNDLPAQSVPSAKAAVSDLKDRDARGVVFYTDLSEPPPWPTGTSWTNKEWRTHDDYLGLYNDVMNFLNTALSPSQAYYSLLCMSDKKNADATIVLYWRA